MIPIKTFVSERRAANLLAQIRWRDGGSRPIKVFPKTSSHPTSERHSFENVPAANPATKRSKSSSKLRYDATNNPLPMSGK
jgi:hypothetical protein